MAIPSVTSSGISPTLQRQIQNAVKNGGSININWEDYFSQGNTNFGANNNSSPWLNLLTQIPQMALSSILGGNTTSTANNVSNTQNTTQTGSENIQTTKQGLTNDLNQLKSLGVNVSNWDNNNSCTLSYQGKTGTITINDNGQVSFSGDIDSIIQLLKQSPEEQESVNNQNKFLEKMGKSGDPIIGDVKTTKIKINGKDILVNEFTSKSGKKYYLDSSGKEVKPDTNA